LYKYRRRYMNELALFAGTGGGILGGKLLGWRTVCGVEIEAYPISVLMQRQNEGILNPFPIWDDVCTFDGKPWQGTVDVVSGGFPCQDISPVATTERKGLDGEKSGLWFQFARIIGEVRPRFVFVENSARLVTNGLSRVLGSLAEMGYDAEWCVLGAVNCGGSHERQRTWIVARDPEMCRRYRGVRQLEREMEKPYESLSLVSSLPIFPRSTENLPVPRVYRSRNGVADRVDRTKAIGNGQVPIVAATAWSILSKRCNC
jgi:DNA (cytosine-5)-methyltransferase 1